jgi:LysM repeat protein
MRKAARSLSLFLLVLALLPVYLAYAQGGTRTHVVRENETLTSIAKRYGVTVEAIIEANKLKDPNAIVIGQTLIIPSNNPSNGAPNQPAQPPSPPGTYTVQPGDTLIGIAGKLGVTVEALMAANKITDGAVIQIGQVLKIPGEGGSNGIAAAPPLPPLPDGQHTLSASGGPPIVVEIAGARLVSLTIQTTSSGKQGFPLSCESKIAGQIAMMYGLNFDEAGFANRLPHSLNPRRGFVGSMNGRFYWPRDVIGGTANGPGGYGVHVEGWIPTFQALSGFGARLLPSSPALAAAQIDLALRRGQPVAAWAILGFRAHLAQNSVWIGSTPNGTAIDCGGPNVTCSYLASGQHAYLILGRREDAYLVYDPGNGEIGYFPRAQVIAGMTTLFSVPTGSAPGAVIVPQTGKVPDMRQIPEWR